MRRLRHIYYLLALIGTMLASCTNGDIIESRDKTQLSLTINLTDTRASEAENYDLATERYISDVAVYLFSGTGDFIERLSATTLMGTDGDATRTIFGVLNHDYSAYTAGVEVVVLTNLATRGVTAPATVSNKTDLYSKLTYNYTAGNEWKFQDSPKQHIPMSGCSSSMTITAGKVNTATISLYRAVARVDVLLNGGEGFDHFTPTGLKITRYNRTGHCASQNGAIHVPADAAAATNAAALFRPDYSTQLYRIYIPEFDNSGAEHAQIELTGNLKAAGDATAISKTYYMNFKFNDKENTDIVRNNLYRFLITKINDEITVNQSLVYEVEKWGTVSVNVPSFN
ncbi:FimB/Mfa2 family fimbrial subunit [Bacteroides helcogenes]|uniref:Major fimbrial subunit protein N-terminal domain-containing protein n=1 Tax=Bacteroides helcogenes (strain ATCC 35417 / DSM 20613 / JCM 6297 / CCUG 15421 / P 36-108) TaxID=693979 RepID=E6SPQ1_BACT6|nr:FimB/Mfa2 family fimbrial subunit [Bacteroides helcogenes]ADV43892.1 hypothetical protein Bache_1914 [Bacteroides helcogenes P 36-108]MDY5237520.1 FimB/Mfa2 family fimbrial subunit [Bacteroides helcogenes]